MSSVAWAVGLVDVLFCVHGPLSPVHTRYLTVYTVHTYHLPPVPYSSLVSPLSVRLDRLARRKLNHL
jgi:hypothetical protein